MKLFQLALSSLALRLAGAAYLAPRENPPSGTSPSANAIDTPTPFQPGMVANCNKFHLVASGDTCGKITGAYGYGITLDQFYAWNPSVGTSCAGLWLGYYVCVGSDTPSTPTTTTTTPPSPTTSGITGPNGVVTPTPIRDGMTPICNKFHYAVPGDNCYDLESRYNMTFPQFWSWNPIILNSCGGLWPGYYYCVGVIPDAPAPVHTPPPEPVVTPEPHAIGLTHYCDKFYQATGPDRQCPDVKALFGIELWQFTWWNPNVGYDCAALKKDIWYCVGVY